MSDYDPNTLPVDWVNTVHPDDPNVTVSPDQMPTHDESDD